MNRNANYSAGILCIIKSLLDLPFFILKLFLSSVISASFSSWFFSSFWLSHHLCVSEKVMSSEGLRRRDTLPRWGLLSPCAPLRLCAPPPPRHLGNAARRWIVWFLAKAMSWIHYCCILLAAFGTSCNLHHCGSERWGLQRKWELWKGRGALQSCFRTVHLGQSEVTFWLWWEVFFFKLHIQGRRPLISYSKETIFFTTSSSSESWQQLFLVDPNLELLCLVFEASETNLLIHSHFSWFSRVCAFLWDTFAPHTTCTSIILPTHSYMIVKVAVSCLCYTKPNESSRAISTVS